MAHQKVMGSHGGCHALVGTPRASTNPKRANYLGSRAARDTERAAGRGERSQLIFPLQPCKSKNSNSNNQPLKSSIHSLENQMRSLVGQQAEEPFRLEATWKPIAIPSASPLDTANHPAFGVLQTEASIHHAMVALSKAESGKIDLWAYPTSGVSMRTYPSVWSAIAGWDFNSAFLCLGGKKSRCSGSLSGQSKGG